MSEHGRKRADLEGVRRTLAGLETEMYEREPGSGDIHWYQPIFECLESLPPDERAAWRERHGEQIRRVLRPAQHPAAAQHSAAAQSETSGSEPPARRVSGVERAHAESA